MSGRGFGTSIVAGVEPGAFRALARGVRQYWCSLGTVCTLNSAEGEYDYTDKRAVISKPEGLTVDVRLEPLDIHVACMDARGLAGEATMMSPVRPGDLVLVECPDGDLTTPVITAIVQSRSNRQPLGEDRKPIFQNDRLLVHTKTVPIDIRTAGGVGVLLDQEGKAQVNAEATFAACAPEVLLGCDASHPVPQGDAQKTAVDALADAVQAFAASLSSNFVISNPIGAAAALATLTTAVQLFKASSYLSGVSKTA